MFLAVKEMRRAKLRFGLLIGAISLLVFLIFFQQSIQNGLITSFVGAIRNQTSPVLVYSVDGQRVVQGSVMTPELESMVRSAEGVGEVGLIGQGTFTGRLDSVGSEASALESFDTSILGYEAGLDGEGLGAPSALAAGRLPTSGFEAVASATDERGGFDVGDVVTLLPGGVEITVVGTAEDIQLNVTPTLFTTYDTYVAAVESVNPDAGAPLPNVLAVRPAAGWSAEAVVASINDQSLDLDALTRSEAASKTPGVAQVQQSFAVIFLLYGLVVPLVTGLFFLIVTFQKAEALTLLRAIGAPAGRLVSSLLLQVLVIVGVGLLVGTALYYPVSQQTIGGVPLGFETEAVAIWAGLLTALGVGSSLFAARRVLSIDPMLATTGAGVGS